MIIVVVHIDYLERVLVSTRWPVKENNITLAGKASYTFDHVDPNTSNYLKQTFKLT